METKIRAAGARLHEARPKAAVILFGSRARGDARPDSDADFLMVLPKKPRSVRREMVKLMDVLRPLRLPVDVLVTDEARFRESAAVPGTLFHTAAREGRVLHGRI